MQMLNRTGLAEMFRTHPAEVIAAIHHGVPTADETDRIFALAELSFLHASRSGDRSYYLAAAVYAYALLFPEGGARAPDAFDPRFRTAVDIYNLGIAEGFTSADGVVIDLRDGTYRLPFGEIAISVRADSFRWSSYRLVRFADASRFVLRGLRNEYRWPGIGAALVASTEYLPGAADPVSAKVPYDVKVAVTLFVRFADVDEGCGRAGCGEAGTVHGRQRHDRHGRRAHGAPGVRPFLSSRLLPGELGGVPHGDEGLLFR
jgi:hypothetical protein